VHSADIERRATHQIVRRHLEIELAQFLYRAGGLINRVVAALRHRAVGSDTAGHDIEPQCAFVADQRIISGGLADYQRAHFAQQPALLDEMRRSAAAALFVCRDHERDARP
jgi:hypothetical protein